MKARRYLIVLTMQILWFCCTVSFFPRELQIKAPVVFVIFCMAMMKPMQKKTIYEFFEWKD
jgi:predicted membrane channel-forming protein YqfA (hemolysin III family)